jgi:leader peptidase (prepilin peptidase)/N-methyltransferase
VLPAFQLQYEILFAVFAFVLGSAIGSFLNVCIYRMPLGVGQSRRSFFARAANAIPWY